MGGEKFPTIVVKRERTAAEPRPAGSDTQRGAAGTGLGIRTNAVVVSHLLSGSGFTGSFQSPSFLVVPPPPLHQTRRNVWGGDTGTLGQEARGHRKQAD